MSDDLVPRWLDYLAQEMNRSPHTIATYARTMRTLPNAATATREEVEEWWHTRVHLAPASRVNELSAVRTFYAWCLKWEHRPDNPALRLDAPAMDKGLPHPMSRADLHKLLGVLEPEMRRAVALGAYAGLRISEVAALTWPDIDLEFNRIRVVGKRKTRLVGLHPVLLDALLPDTGGRVVGPYTAGVLQRKVNRAIHAAGIDLTFHSLRHRYGTIAVGSGANLLAVSRAMGHASPATTAIYAATSDAELDVIAAAVVL